MKYVMAKKKSKAAKKLNPKQRLFCEYYASDREFFGNGVESYMEAFDVQYPTAKTNASRLLTNANILAYIDELIDDYISEQIVDKELGFVIIQKSNLHAKVNAIKEYNAMKGRHAAKEFKFLDDLEETPTEDIVNELHRRKQNTDGSTGKKSQGKKKK